MSSVENALHSGSEEVLDSADAAWALLCSFIILTMNTGFALLEAGCVSSKNCANIMVKNTANVAIGGLAYWLYGFSFSFGESKGAYWNAHDQYDSLTHNQTREFTGWGECDFAFRTCDRVDFGTRSVRYFFQFTFAATTTTIVSGAIAERMKFHTYMVFVFLNTITYAWPVHWGWAPDGWLAVRGFYDFAGTCLVHMVGGVSALIGAVITGPRMNRFQRPELYAMSSPVTALTGMMILWWSWLGFNCGSTFGVLKSNWRVAGVVSITTVNGSIGGALSGFSISMGFKKGMVSIDYLITSLLGGLVAVTGIASVVTTWEALIIGLIGGALAVGAQILLEKLRIDDPVGAIPVHLVGGMWGILAVGLFASSNPALDAAGTPVIGVFHGNGGQQLGIQIAGMLAVGGWAALWALIIMLSLKYTIGVRVSESDEILGADWVEHGVRSVTQIQRLEAALDGMDAHHLATVMKKIAQDIDAASTPTLQKISGRNRVFTVDSGGLDASSNNLEGLNANQRTRIGSLGSNQQAYPENIRQAGLQRLEQLRNSERDRRPKGPTTAVLRDAYGVTYPKQFQNGVTQFEVNEHL